MKKNHFDCLIIGAGPAGIFAALELIENNPELKICLLEKGNSLKKRICPSSFRSIECRRCHPCNITAGWGGAGAFSDGKLNLGKEIGGWFEDYISQLRYEKYLKKQDDIWLRFGAPDRLFGVNEQVEQIKRQILKTGFTTLIGPTRHLGTDYNLKVLENIYLYLQNKIKIHFNHDVAKILVKNQQAVGVQLKNGEKYEAKIVIAAPGREGSKWFYQECQRLNLSIKHHPVQLGVRVETEEKVMKQLTDVLYEAKLFLKTPTYEDTVRTFCMCPGGVVVQEQYEGFKGVVSVNGHSFAGKKTKNTNFALLVSTAFTDPFNKPIIYGENITQLANLLGKTVIVQRLGDLLAGKRSTKDSIIQNRIEATLKTAYPGDLSYVLPYRILTDLIEMIKHMDKLTPGIFSCSTLLYGVEVKFYSSAPKLSRNKLETEINNLFAIGDGAGVTKNLTHACVSGLLCAQEILKRFE